MAVLVWVCFWVFCAVPLVFTSGFVPGHAPFIAVALESSLKSRYFTTPPLLPVLLKIALATWDLLRFHRIEFLSL
jgi:hypothetical protein